MSPLQKQQPTWKQNTYQGLFSSVYTLFSAVWTNEVFTHCWLMLRWEMSSIKSHLALKVKAAALTGKKFTQLHWPTIHPHINTHTRTRARRQSGFRSQICSRRTSPCLRKWAWDLCFCLIIVPMRQNMKCWLSKSTHVYSHTHKHTHTITTIT